MRPRNAAVAREPGHRSRRSSSDVEEAILAATLEILDEAGFEDLTIEAVAARAGAAKTAVYRRWPSKVPLVVEALTRSGPRFEVPDTGSLRTDMIALWHRVADGGVRSIERLLPVVTTYLNSRDDLMEVMRDRYFRPRLQATRAVIARAVARGEIRADADAELVTISATSRWPFSYGTFRSLRRGGILVKRLLSATGSMLHGPFGKLVLIWPDRVRDNDVCC